MTEFHLAQFNIATTKYDVDDPRIADFIGKLDEVNGLADQTPGFVWRWIGDRDGGKEVIEDRPRLQINITVWESLKALHGFVFRSDHTQVMMRKEEWFETPDKPIFCLWWVEAGHRPTVTEAFERLECLHKQGPTEAAFTWSKRFPPA